MFSSWVSKGISYAIPGKNTHEFWDVRLDRLRSTPASLLTVSGHISCLDQLCHSLWRYIYKAARNIKLVHSKFSINSVRISLFNDRLLNSRERKNAVSTKSEEWTLQYRYTRNHTNCQSVIKPLQFDNQWTSKKHRVVNKCFRTLTPDVLARMHVLDHISYLIGKYTRT